VPDISLSLPSNRLDILVDRRGSFSGKAKDDKAEGTNGHAGRRREGHQQVLYCDYKDTDMRFPKKKKKREKELQMPKEASKGEYWGESYMFSIDVGKEKICKTAK